ncbi:MAG: hypothetical protein NTX33_00080 [Propionibacteriales bacterium]|nr:hypothetical protein [Propionibacteriales bacterium]
MSGPDAVVALSYLGAASIGSGVGGMVALWATRTQSRLSASAVQILTSTLEPNDARASTDAGDREAEALLNMHVAAVRDQVGQFADALAAGDPLLRARLRRLEQQMQREA